MQNRESVETEVQSLKAQLLAMRGELEVSRKEAAVAKEELRNVKAEAAQRLEDIKKQAAYKAILSKFGLERLDVDNESINFTLVSPQMNILSFFLVLLSQVLN